MEKESLQRLRFWERWASTLSWEAAVVLGIVIVLTVACVESCRRLTVPPQQRITEVQPRADADNATEKTPMPQMEKNVLESTLAGRWYSADRDELAEEVDGYLASVTDTPPGDVIALVLPHAGYRFSGQTAAHGVKMVAGRSFNRVVIMGPSHQLPMENVLSVPDVTHYSTPLGEIPLDVEFITHLRRHPVFTCVPSAHRHEHSVQIEIPLLQRALADFKIVPIVVGQLDVETAQKAADVMRAMIDPQTLVVASSDFTHYGPNYGYMPFRRDVPANLEKLDLGAFAEIKKRDPAAFQAYFTKTGATICGRCPIMVLLAMLPADSGAHLMEYETSGAMLDDYSNSVSYMSIAFTGHWTKGLPVEEESAETLLSEEDKARLLKLARSALAYRTQHNTAPSEDDLDVEITPPMKSVMGAFVTLHKEHRLRGCIGEIYPSRPLYKAVIDQAINAGLNDYRFPQVMPEELPELQFEISALTPPKPVDSYNDIVVGRHGVVIEKAGRRAVFLPQVAPEQDWDLKQTLSHLCLKAGLGPNDWQEGARFTVFEAIVFCEESA